MGFKDHFSKQASTYAAFRPSYPPELFNHIVTQTFAQEAAWDCATGNGQAAVELARFFDIVLATDASTKQIDNAQECEGVQYAVASAEKVSVPDDSFDLVTAAQALHWFDFEAFFAEVRRVARKDCILATWGYGLNKIESKIDHVVFRYYDEIVGPFWPEERNHVVDEYSSIQFPFERVDSPQFEYARMMPVEPFIGYLRSWSATQRFIKENGSDPLEEIEGELTSLWGKEQKVRWPIFLRMFRID